MTQKTIRREKKKEVEVVSLGRRFDFKLPIRCETAVSVTEKTMTMRIFAVMQHRLRRMLVWTAS